MKTKTTKRHTINEQYSAVVESDNTRRVLIHIECNGNDVSIPSLFISPFNLKQEIDTLYTSCLKSRSDRLKQAKQIDIILNQLD